MTIPVIISVFVGLVVGGASMAIWAARRIGDEAARQFDRGFERGRWLADLSTARGLESFGRTRRDRQERSAASGGCARRLRARGIGAQPPASAGSVTRIETTPSIGGASSPRADRLSSAA